MSNSPAIILTSEFVTSHNEGSVDYLDRKDRQVDKTKELPTSIESEASEIVSLDVIKEMNPSDFSTYLNYLSRQQALEKKSSLSETEELERQTIANRLETLKPTVGSKKNEDSHLTMRGLFDSEGDFLTAEKKDHYKTFFKEANDNGAFLFQDVVSFDTAFLIEQNIYNPLTGELNDKALKRAGRLMMKKYFELENLEQTGQWVGAIHYNTDHFHIHFSTTESVNTRELITITNKQTGSKEIVPNGFKKEQTIRDMKSTFVNALIDRSQSLTRLNELRNSLVKNLREVSPTMEIQTQLNELSKLLPENKNKWQYNRLTKEMKQQVTACVHTILATHSDFDTFKNLLKEEGTYRSQLYQKEDNGEYYKNKLKDMDVRLGNALLKNMKLVEKESLNNSELKEVGSKEKISTNLDNYSPFNQKRLEEQAPHATIVKSRSDWRKEGRLIVSDTTPLLVTVPVMDESGKKVMGFVDGEVFDVTQTMERSQQLIDVTEPFKKEGHSKEKNGTNLDHYSSLNQQRLLEQAPHATIVKSRSDWRKEGRWIVSDTTPLLVTVPVMDESGKKVMGFVDGEVYDVTQTMEKQRPLIEGKSPLRDLKEVINVTADVDKPKETLGRNVSHFSKRNQQLIEAQCPNAQVLLTRKKWLEEGYKTKHNAKPIFIEGMFKRPGEAKSIRVEYPVYDSSQVEKATPQEIRRQLNEENSQYKPRQTYTSKTVEKVSQLLEKDYDKEKARFEKEQLDRKVEYAKEQEHDYY